MNTLVRSTTASLSRRFDGYEPLDHDHDHHHHQPGWRAFSKRKKESHRMPYSRSYRNERAKHRRIFLNSYKLEPAKKLRRRRLAKPPRIKKLAIKITKAVVSVLSFLRIGSRRLTSCDCRLAISASSPTPAHRK
ncbi:hypothetical protein L484_003489 [Morus notabilis]|uniref:Uncharacterized protein n=1 Tax=Morus notabilis TaxID=981085 RepID=W9RIA0_9ROSA|nr:hypothetical protein L484_003489 [Morus notabilis]